MDIYIQNVPKGANQLELRLFLMDPLLKYDIRAFDVFKRVGNNWAVVTVADWANASNFLMSRGSRQPLNPLRFRGVQLCCQPSNKRGGPDVLKLRALSEKEALLRAKAGTQNREARTSRHIFPFTSFMTGVWFYDPQNGKRLSFEAKYRDLRNGTATFGKFALVLYLQAKTSSTANWHCRIDIPYSTIEHTIPSLEKGQRGSITITLKAPPKIYYLLKTDDLHLYSGAEAGVGIDDFLSLQALTLNPKDIKRMRRQCVLRDGLEKSAALCMVYRIVLPDLKAATHAWNFVKGFSALGQLDCWQKSFPEITAPRIEQEYNLLQEMLATTPPGFMEFQFAVRYQLQALVLEGTITPKKMIELIPMIRFAARRLGADITAKAIRKLGSQIPTPAPNTSAKFFDNTIILEKFFENARVIDGIESTLEDVTRKQKAHQHLALTYKATVTPTGLLLRGPDMGVSNRVLRKYASHTTYFMRVFFADEDGLSVLHDPRSSQDLVYERFRHILSDGINVAGRKYDFLGFSHSSLHYHTAWFQAPFIHDGSLVWARDIIENLGDFSHLSCSAKCAARIGQAFSDTIFSVPLSTLYDTVKPDVERGAHCFSDGCGTISKDLLKKVWAALPPDRRMQKPTVLQIRYRGAKGVLSLDTTLQGEQMHLRKSMIKYEAKTIWRDLEICGAAYRPLDLYLNHQFIKILEDLDIPENNFISVQSEALRILELVIRHPINASSFLDYSNSGKAAKVPTLFILMHEIGLSFQADKFLTDMIEIAAMANLRDMKYRARIPVERGCLLYGIMDEFNVLKEGEVFVTTRIQNANGKWQNQVLVRDRIVVTRAPALHPGDIQVVKAVEVPENCPLKSLYNCVVFSQNGARDLPSQLGGGDLDGDLFHIIYDDRLIPSYTVAPSEYPPTAALDLGRPATRDDIIDFFIEYMNSDRLGQISNKHKIRADVLPEGTKHSDCIQLAKLASDAVDFSKSGKAVNMNAAPKSNDSVRPDFMANGTGLVLNELGAAELEEIEADDIDEPDSVSLLDPDRSRLRYYRSQKVLGVLYRKIDEKKFFARMQDDFQASRSAMGGESLMQKLERYVDRETRHVQWDHHQDFAELVREHYEENMLDIMDSMRPHRGKCLTELEVFSGNILGKKEKASTRYIREANIEVRERFNRDVGTIVRRIVSGDEGLNDEETEALPRAIACFKISLETEGWNNWVQLKSWKYVAAAVCLEQMKNYVGFLRPL